MALAQAGIRLAQQGQCACGLAGRCAGLGQQHAQLACMRRPGGRAATQQHGLAAVHVDECAQAVITRLPHDLARAAEAGLGMVECFAATRVITGIACRARHQQADRAVVVARNGFERRFAGQTLEQAEQFRQQALAGPGVAEQGKADRRRAARAHSRRASRARRPRASVASGPGPARSASTPPQPRPIPPARGCARGRSAPGLRADRAGLARHRQPRRVRRAETMHVRAGARRRCARPPPQCRRPSAVRSARPAAGGRHRNPRGPRPRQPLVCRRGPCRYGAGARATWPSASRIRRPCRCSPASAASRSFAWCRSARLLHRRRACRRTGCASSRRSRARPSALEWAH